MVEDPFNLLDIGQALLPSAEFAMMMMMMMICIIITVYFNGATEMYVSVDKMYGVRCIFDTQYY